MSISQTAHAVQPGAPPKPVALAVLPDNIPAELRQRPQWVIWRYEWTDGTNGRPGRWTKVPRDARAGRRASSTDLMTWSTFAEALAAYRARQADGVGFVFCSGDPFAGVDLDKCRDPGTGVIAPWARAVIDKLVGYAEVSPSGCGVKVFVRAKFRDGRRAQYHGGEVEVYGQERFFAVTGHVLPGGAA